jgi:membrane associated rhomboid family serine protease
LTVLPVVALAGSTEKCEHLLKDLSSYGMPAYGVLYWRARCLWATGDIPAARDMMGQALKLTEDRKEAAIWKNRIEKQLERLQSAEAHPQPVQGHDLSAVWNKYEHASFRQQVVAPWKWSRTVFGIVILMTIIFATGRLLELFGGDDGINIVQSALSFGLLDPQRVLNGEYGRLITYNFLHKDELHLFVNMVGLLWFGRLAQNIFGTWALIVIFFVSGISGGIVHTLLAPETLTIGASGGLLGIFGAVCVGIFRLRKQLPPQVVRRELSWLIAVGLSGFVMDQMVPMVATLVHLGGLLGGAAVAFLLPVRQPPEPVATTTTKAQ